MLWLLKRHDNTVVAKPVTTPAQQRESALEPVLFSKDSHDRIGMAMAHLEVIFEKCNLFHVRFCCNLLELLHPIFNGLAVLFLNGREVGSRTGDFPFGHAFMVAKELARVQEKSHSKRRRPPWSQEAFLLERYRTFNARFAVQR